MSNQTQIRVFCESAIWPEETDLPVGFLRPTDVQLFYVYNIIW